MVIPLTAALWLGVGLMVLGAVLVIWPERGEHRLLGLQLAPGPVPGPSEREA